MCALVKINKFPWQNKLMKSQNLSYQRLMTNNQRIKIHSNSMIILFNNKNKTILISKIKTKLILMLITWMMMYLGISFRKIFLNFKIKWGKIQDGSLFIWRNSLQDFKDSNYTVIANMKLNNFKNLKNLLLFHSFKLTKDRRLTNKLFSFLKNKDLLDQ